ncbi:MAG: Fe-S cluster assembly protein SufB [Candidatus Levybacteria bacterium]|nr:Fe-S cluster assembly protein SufB [Candidatus Levybacteria bacterium]
MQRFDLQNYEFGFHDKIKPFYVAPKGLSDKIVQEISYMKKEPEWMLQRRLGALQVFYAKPTPTWGGDLSRINFDNIYYYVKPTDKQGRTWDDIPAEIKNTFDKIGIPEAEKKFLAGVGAQYDSEVVYHSISKMLEKKGVIFVDTDTAVQKYPELVREHFGRVIPAGDNKFAALNTAVWSGGSFIYVPKGIRVELPLQAYFRINAKNMGQFERTLIIADEGSYVHYVEGCTAPIFTTDSLHAAVVEIIVKRGARVRYTTIQNWSKNVYNLVTKRMFVEEEGIGEWVDGNLGSQLTMKYPSVYLKGRKARGEVLSLAFAGKGQHQDAGGKAIHLAPETSSVITSKSVSKDGGRTSYRGLLRVAKGAVNSKSTVRCDALILDPASRSDTYPTMDIQEERVTIGHEASVSRIGEEQLFYFQSRGIPQQQAEVMIVNGFMEPIVKELPMEYAVELNRLIQLEMTGSVG